MRWLSEIPCTSTSGGPRGPRRRRPSGRRRRRPACCGGLRGPAGRGVREVGSFGIVGGGHGRPRAQPRELGRATPGRRHGASRQRTKRRAFGLSSTAVPPRRTLLDVTGVVPSTPSSPRTSGPRSTRCSPDRGGARRRHRRPPTYAATLGVLDQATAGLDWVLGVASHLESTVARARPRSLRRDPAEGRRRSTAASPRRPRSSARSARSPHGRSGALDPARASSEDARRLPAQRRGPRRRRQGAACSRSTSKLTEATLKFSQNVVDATSAYELIVEDGGRLAASPRPCSGHRPRRGRAGPQGHRLTLHAPIYGPVVTYAEDRGLREALFRAHATRAASRPFDNRALILRILELRRDRARLLGFRDFADLAIDDRMAKTGADAAAFVEPPRSARARVPRGRRTRFARAARGHVGGLGLDVSFYAERQRKALHDLDDEALRPYFPLDGVLGALRRRRAPLRRAHRSLGGAPTWPACGPTGSSPRTARRSAASTSTRSAGHEARRRVDGRHPRPRHRPERPRRRRRRHRHERHAAARDGAPALLTHRGCRLLFHEFGHLLHHCLSRTTVRSPVRHAGGVGLRRAALDDPRELGLGAVGARALREHHRTGAPIPDDLVARMRARAPTAPPPP